MNLFQKMLEKLNPAQVRIHDEQGHSVSSLMEVRSIAAAYKRVEVVRNGVDRCVNAIASFDYDVTDQIPGMQQRIRPAKLKALLNFRPNPYQDASRFRRTCVMDLFLDGNIFLYWDGSGLYHLPATSVEILTDDKEFVSGYKYSGQIMFKPDEVIHIMENNGDSIYRGVSRLQSAMTSINTVYKMAQFQEKFFENGAIPGLVIESDNVLGDKMKDRLLASWQQRYSPTSGGRRPLILDGGLKVRNLMDKSFQELDFQEGTRNKEEAIMMALGVPYLLLRGGNNANITPNLRLFYLETVYPVVLMIARALENYFGFDIKPEPDKISAMQPEMKDSSLYYTTLVNGGVLTPNEARTELRYPPAKDGDELRVPANIAGSASNPAEGGRPNEGKK